MQKEALETRAFSSLRDGRRGQRSIQAAAEVEHVVVRGTESASEMTKVVVNPANAYDPTLMEHHQDPLMASLGADMEVYWDRHSLNPLQTDSSEAITGIAKGDDSARERDHIPPSVEVSSS